MLGDSISAAYGMDLEQGWVALLQEHLNKNQTGWVVINASISGDTTGGGLQRLPDLLQRHSPDVVVIELGGNDGLRGLPPQRLGDNLTRMIELSEAAGAEPVLLGMRIPPNYGQAYTRLFEQAFKKVAGETGVPFVPFLLDGVVEAGQMQRDGIHPTAEAHPGLLKNAWPAIKPALPDHCDL